MLVGSLLPACGVQVLTNLLLPERLHVSMDQSVSVVLFTALCVLIQHDWKLSRVASDHR